MIHGGQVSPDTTGWTCRLGRCTSAPTWRGSSPCDPSTLCVDPAGTWSGCWTQHWPARPRGWIRSRVLEQAMDAAALAETEILAQAEGLLQEMASKTAEER